MPLNRWFEGFIYIAVILNYALKMRVSKEFIRYCLVGMINTFAGLSTAYVFLNVLSSSYLVATAMAYVVGIIVSFSLNKIFTFKDESKNYLVQFLTFVFTMLPSYVFSYFSGWLVAKFIFKLHFALVLECKISALTGIMPAKVSDNIAILISMVIYLLLGFAVNKYLVFKNQKGKK